MLCGVEVKSEQMTREMESYSAVLTLVGSSFHRSGAKIEKSCEFAELLLFAFSDGATGRPADVVKCSCWGAWSDQCLEVDRFSSIDGHDGQHHHLELDASHNRRPVGVTWEHLGRL